MPVVVVAMAIPQIAGWLALRPLTVDWLNGSVEPDRVADYGRDKSVTQIAPLRPEIAEAARADRAYSPVLAWASARHSRDST